MAEVRHPDFYLAHRDYVRMLARRLVYDPHAADDLFQSAWLAALQRPPRDDHAPRRWLARIVRNLASKTWLRTRRRQQREQHWEPPPPPSSPDAVLAHEQERRRLVDALLALEEPYRATLIARFFDGLEPPQIAARDGLPVETVRTRLKRGLERLRERLLRDPAHAVAFLHGLQLGAPGAGAVLRHVVQGMMLMHTKKLLLSAGILLVAAIGWLALPPPAPARRGADAAPPAVVAADLAAPAATTQPPPGQPESHRVAMPAANEAAGATGTLEVHVRWADHRPAADIEVHVTAINASNHAAGTVGRRTGSDGNARFPGLEPGAAWVACDRGAQQPCTILAGERSAATLTIDQGLLVRGHVHDHDGRPVSGAQIHLRYRFEPHAGHVVAHTGADGAFAIVDAPAGPHLAVCAFAADRAPTPQQVVTGRAGDTVDVTLRFAARGGAVLGRVVDPLGAPVVGAFVLLGRDLGVDLARAKAAGSAPLPPVDARGTNTDERGEWRVDGLAAGPMPVLVLAPRCAPWQGEAFVVAEAAVRCDAVLLPGVRLQGTVRDERGAPLAGATVQVSHSLVQTWRTTTDANGAYALDGLPTTSFTAIATSPGAGEARTTQAGAAGATLPWDPVLQRATTLRGRLLAAGQPVAGARIEARCMPSAQQQWFANARTDDRGAFVITNCPDALLHLDARTESSQHFAVCQRDDVDPRAGEITLEVDAARLPSAFVTGRVLDPDGRPVGGAEVLVMTADSSWGGGHAMRSTDDGRFRSPAVPPGPWYLTVQAAGFAPHNAPARPLAAGATGDFGDLVLVRGTTLVVTLQPEAGIALTSCVVGIADAVVGLGSSKPERGVVRFAPLAPGDYTITAYAEGAALRPLRVHVGDEPVTSVDLPLRAGSEVTVDVVDANATPVVDRLETELLDGAGACIDSSPLIPAAGPLRWVRRLVAGRYELRLRDHRQRTGVVSIVVPADGRPVQSTARLQ